MSRGINKVILIGNCGHDASLRMQPNSGAVTNVTLATSETWKDKNTGQQQERTEWHRVVFFNRLAEIAGEYLKKGQQVYIEGSLRTRKWQDKDGQDRYTTEIVADQMQMLGSVRDKQNSAQHGIADSAPNFNDNTVPNNNASGYAPPQPNMGGNFDDDIPFAPYERNFY